MQIRSTGIVFDDPTRSTPGYILIRPAEGNQAILLDSNGDIAHTWNTGGGITNWTYLLPNGHLFANEHSDDRRGVALTVSGRLSEYDKNGKLVWRHDDPYQHHDARRLNDGAIYAAYSELSENQKKHIKGGVTDSESPGGPFDEVIRQINDDGQTTWEWSLLSSDLSKYPLHRNSNRWSYGHINTVYPLRDGKILVSSKNLCLLFILDPVTDQVVWEYQNDDLGGQHDATELDNGNLLCFANGAYAQDLHHSQVWEICPSSKEIVWSYKAKDNMTSFFSPHMGGAQRLPSGNTLICEGNKGCIFEVNDIGDVVWEFVSPYFVSSNQFGRHNWLFRCRWYAPDAPEIKALDL